MDTDKYIGCAQGYFTIPSDINTYPKAKAEQFLYELWTRGGRIGHYEYVDEMKKLGLKP